MELFFQGHDYKYAVEQIMLMLFPGERPVYPEAPPEEDASSFYATVSLREDAAGIAAETEIVKDGVRYAGSAETERPEADDAIVVPRLRQRALKQSFYRAAVRLLGEKPVWGALSGVRPARLMRGALKEAPDEETAARRFMELYDVSPERTALCLDAAKQAAAAERTLGPKDVCLYVSIPFCPTRCSYCSFVSQPAGQSKQADLIDAYLETLRKEIFATAAALEEADVRVVSLYFGGGTPTILTPEQLRRLLMLLDGEFDLSRCREITVEGGRPDTITAEKLEVLEAHGVGRVSVNPQSMSARVLDAIGRRHSAADVIDAMALVKSFNNRFSVNMDLIAGLPEDTVGGFVKSVGLSLGLRPENLTVHTLARKRGSRLTAEGARLPSGREVGEMLAASETLLRERGYRPYYLYRQKYMSGGYENVGWSLPGKENLYNICVMEELRSVIAMGAGGSTKLTLGDGRLRRMFTPKYPKEYIETITRICGEKSQIAEFYSTKKGAPS